MFGTPRSAPAGFGRRTGQARGSRHDVLLDLGPNRLEDRTLLSLAGASHDQILQTYGQIPLSFEVNQGQTAAQVDFLSRGSGYALFLTPTETVLSLQKPAPAVGDGAAAPDPAVLHSRFVGANPQPQVVGLDQLAGTSNYCIGNDPSQWQTDIANYGRVEYHNLYPGVDLVFYGNQRQLEYDYVVAPGTDPGVIKLAIDGAESMTLDDQGDLVLHTSGGDILEHAPVVYQDSGGVRQPISGQFVLEGDGQVGFALGAYDHSQPLVIDPVLSYSTYLGGTNSDACSGIAVDSAGNAYVTGYTESSDFPTTPGAVQTSYGGGQDAFVTKLNSTGTALVYSTYLGGTGDAVGWGIAVDTADNAYVTGYTSSTDFPTTPGALQTTYGGVNSYDAFVTKLNPTGTALVYSTYLGGTGLEYGYGIAVDSAGNAYVTGHTESTDFPTTPGAVQTSYGGLDAFVTKLNPTGTALVYSTYLGGNSGDGGYSIAVDSADNAYVTGYTWSTDFPTTPGAVQTSYGGGQDAFVTKLNPTGTALVYSTYLGGTSSDLGRGIAVDAAGNAYVTGQTGSTDFPTTPGAVQTSYSGGQDAFVTKLNPTGTALVYSTYLGDYSDGYGIAVDTAGNAYVTGYTSSTDFPTTPGAYQTAFGGYADAFVAKFAFETQTTTVLTTSASPSTYGDSVTFTAAVTAQGNPVTSGTVDFKEGGTVLASMVPLSASGTASFSTSLLSAVTHTITAFYSGASGFDASSSSVQQIVNQKAATVTANDSSKVYGSVDPVLTGSTSGFLAADGVTASFSRAAGETVAGSPYAISATLSTAGVLGNYTITYHTAEFTITARPITVTADAESKPYGDSDPALTYRITAGNLVNGDGFSGSLTRAAGENVGSYAITQGTLALSSNYDLTFVGANLTIGQRPITVTADAQTKVYGTADPALTYQITSGSLVSGDRFSGALTRAAGQDVGAYPIGQGTLSAGMNYALIYIGNTLTITPATPAINWTNPADITYGTALASTQLDAATNVAGTFTYTPAADTILGAGSNQLLSVSFTPADSTNHTTASTTAHINVLMAQPSFSQLTPSQSITFGQSTNVSGKLAATSAIPTGEQVSISIGSASVTATISPGGSFSATIDTNALGVLSTPYTITYSYAGDANFRSASDASTTLTVNRTTPTLNWPNPADIAYGTPLSSTQLDATASVSGSFTYTPAAGTVLKAGAGQALSISFTPTDRTDYATVTATVAISVTQATPVLTVSAPGGSYNGTPFPAAVTIASGIPGLNDAPAASLEKAAPILTYYEGAGTSGTSLSSTPPTAAGTYTIVARFPGSSDYTPTQSAPVVFTIDRGVAAIAVAVSTSSAVYGQSITFVATVASASVPSGTVTFFDGATSLATIPLDGSGKVTLTTTGLAIGSHAITATYSGDADFFGVQSGSTTESVSQAATEIALVPHPVLRKKNVVSVGLTAEVVPVPPGGGVPTGKVTFEFLVKHGKKLQVKTLGTAALRGGEATLTVKPKAVLNKPITIIYSGDPNYRASTLTPPKLTQKALKSLARPTVARQ
jgi:hypothetical protein